MASRFQNVTDADVGTIKNDAGNFSLLLAITVYASKRLNTKSYHEQTHKWPWTDLSIALYASVVFQFFHKL